MDREAMIAALIFGGSGSGGGGGADAPFVIKFTKQNNTIKTDKTSSVVCKLHKSGSYQQKIKKFYNK